MTWKQLADKINGMDAGQQDTDVSVLLMDSGEVFGIMDFVETWDVPDADTTTGQAFGVDLVAGVLDDGHPYITVDF